MSFYYIKNNYFVEEDTCCVNPDVSIFNEIGIEDAKKKLVSKCKEDIRDDLKREQSILNESDMEYRRLMALLDFWNTTKKIDNAKDAVISRLNELEKKMEGETAETQRLIELLNSDDLDEILKESKYEVVEIPILDSCSEEALKEIY